ncbi:MAG: hypothetical protein U0903_03820 [Planctomycetales bacterium]
MQHVYPHPEYIETLATSTAIAEHVTVDFELRGCPVNRFQLVEVILSLAAGGVPGLRLTVSAWTANDVEPSA